MMIKFNWGTGIVIAIVVMVLFIASLVYVATKQSFNLVEDDYYERGVRYQEQIEKRINSSELTKPVNIVQSKNKLALIFPVEFASDSVHGTIHFYSPVNKTYDFKTEINTDEELNQEIDTKELNKGRYILKIDWKTKSKSYYLEQNVNIK